MPQVVNSEIWQFSFFADLLECAPQSDCMPLAVRSRKSIFVSNGWHLCSKWANRVATGSPAALQQNFERWRRELYSALASLSASLRSLRRQV